MPWAQQHVWSLHNVLFRICYGIGIRLIDAFSAGGDAWKASKHVATHAKVPRVGRPTGPVWYRTRICDYTSSPFASEIQRMAVHR